MAESSRPARSKVRLSKIYTKKGDTGTTQLATGGTIFKHELRLRAYGEIDELNCVVGDLVVTAGDRGFAEIQLKRLARVQQELFDVGGELSFPGDDAIAHYSSSYIRRAAIDQLETEMDEILAALPGLANFVLPGGHVVNTKAHVCRAVCRRAERAMVELHQHEPLRAEILAYINRLSDWFFVMSREACRFYQIQEILWDQTRYHSMES